jgi:predicted nucleic acid-binding protein
MSKYFFDANFIIAIFREIEVNNELAISKCEELLSNHECYISNAVFNEVITVLMMRIKDLELTIKAYYFMKDNLIILNEFGINNFNENVFEIFKKYNKKTFKVSFTDCSIVFLFTYYNLDYIVTFDKNFKLFEDINLLKS